MGAVDAVTLLFFHLFIIIIFFISECGISRPRTVTVPESSFRRRRSSGSHSLLPGDGTRSKRSVVGGKETKVNAWPWMVSTEE